MMEDQPKNESQDSSKRSSPMAHSLEDFLHVPNSLSMTSSTISKSQYSQIIFHDLSEIYPTDCDIICRYSLTDDVNPQPGDKIVLFKVGWVSVSEYLTFVRAPAPENGLTATVIFKAESLPKDATELYQLCYVTCGNVIAGASTPFCFHKPQENELVAVEHPSDSSFVVFQSRVTQIQDELNKKCEENDALLLKQKLFEEKVEVLKTALDKCDTELCHTKEQLKLAQMEECEEIKALKTECDTFKSENYRLRDEIDGLKKKVVELETNVNDVHCLTHTTVDQLANSVQLLQLEKKETDITLNYVKKENSDLIAQRDEIHLVLQQKLQELEVTKLTSDCLELDKKRLDDNLKEQLAVNEELRVENNSLELKLQKLAEKNNKVVLESLTLNEELVVAKTSIKDLQEQVENLNIEKKRLQGQLAANEELRVENHNLELKLQKLAEKNNKVVLESLTLNEELVAAKASNKELQEQIESLGGEENDDEMLKARFLNLIEHHAKCENKIKALQEAVARNEETTNKINDDRVQLRDRVKSLELELNTLKTQGRDPRGDLIDAVKNVGAYMGFKLGKKTEDQDPEEELDLQTRYLMLRNQKLALRSELVQIRHEKGELERILAATREETASLKSRINVLELEVSAAKKPTFSAPGQEHDYIVQNIPAIMKFNEIIVEQNFLGQKLNREREERAALQLKVEDLLMKDAETVTELENLKKEHHKVLLQMEELRNLPEVASVDMLRGVLDESDLRIKTLNQELVSQKDLNKRLDAQLIEMRVMNVGKVTASELGRCHEEIGHLRNQLSKKENCLTQLLETMKTPGNGLACPICKVKFPKDRVDILANHFPSHLD